MVQPKGTPCANNHCSTRYEQIFDKINIHKLKADIDPHSRHNHKVHRKIHQGTKSLHNIQNPYSVNLKLAFPKALYYHSDYLTYTRQIYHDPDHRFKSWPTQMATPSHLHKQARVQQKILKTIPI